MLTPSLAPLSVPAQPGRGAEADDPITLGKTASLVGRLLFGPQQRPASGGRTFRTAVREVLGGPISQSYEHAREGYDQVGGSIPRSAQN